MLKDYSTNKTEKKRRLAVIQKWHHLGEEANHVVPSNVMFTHNVE